MYRLLEGGIARAQYLGRSGDYRGCVANHERGAREHIVGSKLHQRRDGEAGSWAVCAGCPVRRG